MTTEPQTVANPRRKILQMAVGTLLIESGFDAVEKDALETLTEMFQAVLCEMGHSAKCYCELSGRTEPVIGDVIIALINMGIKLDGIEQYGRKEVRHVIPTPQQAQAQKPLSILSAGTKHPHPSHIPNHLPDLPDPHSYIRTPTYKQPITEYEAIHEKASNMKKDIEKALTKFLAKTSDTHSLFETEDNVFPLITPKPIHPAYMAALNPTDQVFDFEELEYYYQVANRKEDISSKDEDGSDGGSGDEKEKDESKEEKEDEKPPKDQTSFSELIDNPYLRAATMPKRARTESL